MGQIKPQSYGYPWYNYTYIKYNKLLPVIRKYFMFSSNAELPPHERQAVAIDVFFQKPWSLSLSMISSSHLVSLHFVKYTGQALFCRMLIKGLYLI